MPKNRKLQNIIGTEHITDSAEAAIAAQATIGDIVGDTTPQLGGNLDVNGNDIVSVSNGDIELAANGTGQVIFKGNATKGAGQFKLNCEQNSHGIIIKGPPHSASASYTLTLPNTDGAANEVLKTDGSGNLDWVAQSSGGGGGLPIHHVDEDNPPTFSNGAAYGSSSLGFSATPGIPQTSSIGGGNFTTSSIHLWAIAWPNDDHYIDSIKMRVFSASNAGVESSCQMAFYKADANGWFGARTGSNVTITPTSTGAHFLTTTLGSGSGIGPFNRGDLIWVGFAGPAATQRGQTVGTIRFYGQGTNAYPVAGMAQSTAGPNPGYSYLMPYRLNVNSGGLNALPSDLRDASTWSIPDGSPSTFQIIPSTFTLSSSFYFPAIQIHMRNTA